MQNVEDRFQTLIKTLSDPSPRHPSEGSSFTEGRWAAIMLKNEFKEDTVIPVAAILSFWNGLNPDNQFLIRQFGFRNPEIARRCRNEGLANAVWCLEQIPVSGAILVGELKNEDAGSRLHSALALGFMRYSAAVEPLIDILSDSEKEVVDAAASALTRITGKSFVFGNKNPEKWKKWWHKNK